MNPIHSSDIPYSDIPQTAAMTATLWSTRRHIADWIATTEILKPFPSNGPHASLGLVFPIGTPVFLSVSEWERRVGQVLPPGTEIPPLSSYQAQRFLCREELFDLKSLLKQLPEPPQRILAELDKFLSAAKRWFPVTEMEQLIHPLKDPSLDRWLRNSKGSIPLHKLDAKKIHAVLNAIFPLENIEKFLLNIQAEKAVLQGSDPERSAVLKTGTESFYEFAPAHVARLLRLDSALVPTALCSTEPVQISFEGTAYKAAPLFPEPLVAVFQPNISKGMKPTTLMKKQADGSYTWPKEVLKKISLSQFQEISLFVALTKQNDLHWGNAYFVEAGNKLEARLFDIGRSLLPPGFEGHSADYMLSQKFLQPLHSSPSSEPVDDEALSIEENSLEAHKSQFPFEMEVLSLYEKVLGKEKGLLYAETVSITELFNWGLEKGKLTEEEISEWSSRIKNALKDDTKPLGLKEHPATHKLTLRSFFMTWPAFDAPLSKKMLQHIRQWDVNKLKDEFWITPTPTRTENYLTDELKQRQWQAVNPDNDPLFSFSSFEPIDSSIGAIRKLEQSAQDDFSKTLTQEQWVELKKRIVAIQKLTQNGQRPTMRQIYEKCFPVEMTFIPLYERVIGQDKGVLYTGAISIENIIQQGLQEGKLTQEEAALWEGRLQKTLEDPLYEELGNWVYPY